MNPGGGRVVPGLDLDCMCSEYTAMIDLTLIEGFEWDEGNARKNEKHDETSSFCLWALL